jgi:hypothetical protein
MITWKQWAAAAGFALGVLTLSGGATEVAAGNAPAVDPAAGRILKQMTDHLDSLKQFSVRARNTIEELNPSGHRVDLDMTADVTVRRPNKLIAVRSGELTNQRILYDGKTLTLYNPAEKVYATQPAPETIEGMIALARETIGIVLPAADLLYRNAYSLFMQDVTVAAVVGKAIVGGVRCDHLLFSRPGVDFQIWVEEGKQPWPRKYVVTETDTAARLSITSYLSDWNTAPAAADALFAFVPPKGTSATRFIPYGKPARPAAETERK